MNSLCFIQQNERNCGANKIARSAERPLPYSSPLKANPQLIKEKALTSVSLFSSLLNSIIIEQHDSERWLNSADQNDKAKPKNFESYEFFKERFSATSACTVRYFNQDFLNI